MLWLALLACSGPVVGSDGDGVVVGAPTGDSLTALEPFLVEWEVERTLVGGPPARHHGTFQWGSDDHIVVARSGGQAPNTVVRVSSFDLSGNPISPVYEVHADGTNSDKPDIELLPSGGMLITHEANARMVGLIETSVTGESDGLDEHIAMHQGQINGPDVAINDAGEVLVLYNASNIPGHPVDYGEHFYRRRGGDGVWIDPDPVLVYAGSKTVGDVVAYDGGWALVWTTNENEPSGLVYHLQGLRIDETGATTSFRADDLVDRWPSRPSLVSLDTGFAMAFRDKTSPDGSDLGAGCFVRLFDQSASAVGPSIRVNDPAPDGDRCVLAASLEDDVLAMVWEQEDDEGVTGVFMRLLDQDLGFLSKPMQVSPSGGLRDRRPAAQFRRTSRGLELMVIWETERGTVSNEGLRARLAKLTAQ